MSAQNLAVVPAPSAITPTDRAELESYIQGAPSPVEPAAPAKSKRPDKRTRAVHHYRIAEREGRTIRATAKAYAAGQQLVDRAIGSFAGHAGADAIGDTWEAEREGAVRDRIARLEDWRQTVDAGDAGVRAAWAESRDRELCDAAKASYDKAREAAVKAGIPQAKIPAVNGNLPLDERTKAFQKGAKYLRAWVVVNG